VRRIIGSVVDVADCDGCGTRSTFIEAAPQWYTIGLIWRPLSGVDPFARKDYAQRFRDACSKGCAVLAFEREVAAAYAPNVSDWWVPPLAHCEICGKLAPVVCLGESHPRVRVIRKGTAAERHACSAPCAGRALLELLEKHKEGKNP
jgi:hypothetical protein